MTTPTESTQRWLGLAQQTAGEAADNLLRTPDLDVLAGAVVLVTGAGRGIGRGIAASVAASGAHAVVADRDAAAAAETAEQLASAGGSAEARAVDITDQPAVEALVAQVAAARGRLDAVVNNAGIVHVDDLLEMPVETWRNVFRVNVEGTFVVAQAAARVMARQEMASRLFRRGIVVNISSGAARIGRPHLAAYGASKAAVDHLTKSLDAALREREVAAVTVYPGNIREGMWGHLGEALAKVQGREREDVEAEREFQSADEFGAIVRDVVATPGLLLSGRTLDWERRNLST
jgi:meso-butanediol dehydrogenase/(S,S)-butanediol dehydrogenase/diacetyl reductase